ATNHKPIIRGTDDGIWRRMKMIPFKYQIPDHRVDKNLKYKLRKELPAILNWAVEGALKWQKDGLKNPRVVEEANKEYRTEMDVIELFMQECCAIDESYSIQAKVLYQTYKDWAKENNQYEMNNTRFGKEMGQKFGKHKTHGQIKYFGLMINDEYDQKTFSINY
ncbi:MAG: DNA primase, partial [Sphingobacteriia bacterium]|nr:DNA primase [Sphingobacteriia bacterium]